MFLHSTRSKGGGGGGGVLVGDWPMQLYNIPLIMILYVQKGPFS